MTTTNKPLAAVCGARCKCGPKQIAKAAAAGPKALEKLLKLSFCRNKPVPGRRRCYLHGGYSTGPVTAEARATIASNLRNHGGRGISRRPARSVEERQNILKRNAEIRQLVADRRMRSVLSGATIAQGDAPLK